MACHGWRMAGLPGKPLVIARYTCSGERERATDSRSKCTVQAPVAYATEKAVGDGTGRRGATGKEQAFSQPM